MNANSMFFTVHGPRANCSGTKKLHLRVVLQIATWFPLRTTIGGDLTAKRRMAMVRI